jgi:hypothetical protein
MVRNSVFAIFKQSLFVISQHLRRSNSELMTLWSSSRESAAKLTFVSDNRTIYHKYTSWLDKLGFREVINVRNGQKLPREIRKRYIMPIFHLQYIRPL